MTQGDRIQHKTHGWGVFDRHERRLFGKPVRALATFGSDAPRLVWLQDIIGRREAPEVVGRPRLEVVI